MRFSSNYLHYWNSLFQTETTAKFIREEWRIAISKFTEQDVERAFQKCIKEDHAPPSLPKFISYCREGQSQHGWNQFLRLPKVTCDPDVARTALEAMKNIFK